MPINYENVRSFGAVATDTLPTPAADGGLAQVAQNAAGVYGVSGGMYYR